MTTTGRFDASRASGALQVEHCDIPADMTLAEWRRCGGRLPAVGETAAAVPPTPSVPTGHGARRARRSLGLRRALRLA